MEKLKQFFNQQKGLKILDVGTGGGAYIGLIKELYKDYSEIIGIDTSEMAIKTANKNFQDDERITFQLTNARKMNFEDNEFDVVILSNSIHHLVDVGSIFGEMERVCKPGGYILISEMISNDLNEKQMSHKMLHHFAAEIDRLLGDTHNETLSDKEILETLQQHLSFPVIESWNMELEEAPEVTEEELEWFNNVIDRIITRVVDPMKKTDYVKRGNEIKEYIKTYGYDRCTTLIALLQNK